MNLTIVSASTSPDRPTFAGPGPFVVLVGTKQAHLDGVTIGARCRLVHDLDSPLRFQGVSDAGHPVHGFAWVLLCMTTGVGRGATLELLGKHVRLEVGDE